MADEAEVQVQDEVAAAEVVDDSDADFDSGFSGKPTEVTPPATGEPVIEQAVTEAPVTPEYVQVQKADWERVLAQSTLIEQIRADAKKGLDTAFGKVGGLERKLAELQSATPAGHTVEVTDDIVADLAEEFPELSKHTLTAFKAFASKLKGGVAQPAPFDPNQVVPLITDAKKEMAREILSIKHEDWEEVVGLPDKDGVVPDTEYRKWLAKQSTEYQAQVSGSWDARAIAKSIDKFRSDAKAAVDAAAKAAAPKPTPAPVVPSARQARLAAAVTPRGEGGHPPAPTDDDEFDAGFKSG